MSLKEPASTSKYLTPPISLSRHISQSLSTTASPSPSPSKKRRIDSIASSSSVNSPALTDEDALYRKRYNASMGVLSFWDSLQAKYARDLADDDIVDLYSQTIVQDKGVIRSEPEREIGSFAYAISATKGSADGTATPISVDISDDEDDAQEEEVDEDEDDFEGWSNITDQFNRSRPASLASSPRKPLFGSLPPIPTTTDEEDLTAFMAVEQARQDREGDFDAKLDAKLRAERAVQRAQRRGRPMSDGGGSLSTLPSNAQDSDDELNLGYTPSPSKREAPVTHPTFHELDQESGAESDGLEEDYFPPDEGIDPLGENDQTSDDEMLLGPPVASPSKKMILRSPSVLVRKPDPVQMPKDEVGEQDYATESDIDPIDTLSPPPPSPRSRHRYVTGLSPLRNAPQASPSPSVHKLRPPSIHQQLWTPPTSSVEPCERNPGVKLWLASVGRTSSEENGSDSQPHLASPPLSSASLSSISAVPSSYLAQHLSNTKQKPTFKTSMLPTVELRNTSHPSSLRRGVPSPEKKQRVLQFDTTPRYDSDDLHSLTSRPRETARSRSPSPPSVAERLDSRVMRQRSAPLGKRKRDLTLESEAFASKDHCTDVTEPDVEDEYESGSSSPQSIDRMSDSDSSDQEDDDDTPPSSQAGRRSRGLNTASRTPPSKQPPREKHVSAPPTLPPPMPYHPPPQPPAHLAYGYSQIGQCPDPAVLSHVIHSLNYLASNGFNAPAPTPTPPVAQPQHCSPPHPLMHVPHIPHIPHLIPHTPYYPYPPHPYPPPHPTSPRTPWTPTFPTPTESSQARSPEPPQTPRPSRRRPVSPKAKTRKSGAIPETEDVFLSPSDVGTHRKHDSGRRSSLSLRKSARATSTPTRSRASTSSSIYERLATPKSSPTGTESARGVDKRISPFVTPKRVRDAPHSSPFATPCRSTSAREMERSNFLSPNNLNPSPLRRSVTASDLYDDDLEESRRSRAHRPKSRGVESCRTANASPTSKNARGRSNSRGPPVTTMLASKSATPTSRRFRNHRTPV